MPFLPPTNSIKAMRHTTNPKSPVSLITSIRTAAVYPSLHEILGCFVSYVSSVTELPISTVLLFAEVRQMCLPDEPLWAKIWCIHYVDAIKQRLYLCRLITEDKRDCFKCLNIASNNNNNIPLHGFH